MATAQHGTAGWRQTGAVLLAWLTLGPGFGGPSALARQIEVRQRGKQIRVETRKTLRKSSFTCELAPAGGSYPRFRFGLVDLITRHEVPIYQALLEIRNEDERDRTKIEYRILPGEEIEGEMSLRHEKEDMGPAKNMDFRLNKMPITTDAAGFYSDTDQRILALFDDLRLREVTASVTHAEMGRISVPLERNLVLPARRGGRPPAKRPSLAQDVLSAMGLDFEQKRQSGHDGLVCRLEAPRRIRPGERVRITVHATNTGKLPVSSLLYRSFSRHAWLNGRMFYLGGIEPGRSRTFFRVFDVPADFPRDGLFAALGCWDILGPVPGAKMRLYFEAVPQADGTDAEE